MNLELEKISSKYVNYINKYDYTIEYKNKYIFIKSLHGELKTVDIQTLLDDNIFDYIMLFKYVLEETISINNIHLTTDIFHNLVTFLNELVNKKYITNIIPVLEVLNNSKNDIFNKFVEENIKTIGFNIELHKNNLFEYSKYNLHINTCQEIINLYKKYKFPIRKLNYEIAQSYHLESIYQQGRAKKSYSVKASFLEEAENYYKTQCNDIEMSKELRPNIRSCYGLIIQHEMYEISLKEDASCSLKVQIQKFKNFYLKTLNKTDVLKNLAVDSRLIPNYQEVIEMSNKMSKQSTFMNIVPITPVCKTKKLGSYSTDLEHEKFSINESYRMLFDIKKDLKILPLIYELINAKVITPTSILEYLNKWSLIDKSRSKQYSYAINNIFYEDDISAVYILVPLIEHQVRYMFDIIGYSITDTHKGKEQTDITFGRFLKDDFVEQQLGQDLTELLKYVYTSNIGLNIRNSIAHGFFDDKTFTNGLSYLVLYTLIVLTKFSLVEK